jgi:hypothetical protein
MQWDLVGDWVDPKHLRNGLAGDGPYISADLPDDRRHPVILGQNSLVCYQRRIDQVQVLLHCGNVGLTRCVE